MRKEVVFAIVAGLIFGLVIAFGVWRVNLAFKPKEDNQTSTQEPAREEGFPTELKITIAQPVNSDVLNQSETAVTGITKPNTWVVISGQNGDYLTKSGDNGAFRQDVALESALNLITATAVGQDGATTSQTLSVVYSTEIDVPASTPSAPTGSDSTEGADIRQKVQQKVEETVNKPKAFIGSVADFADSTIQIKTSLGEISQISVKNNQNITVVKIGSDTKTKQVKLTDIAIGDFIIAMGIKNQNNVLLAQRILITSPREEKQLEVYLGKIIDSSKKEIAFVDAKDNKRISSALDKNTDIFVQQEGKTALGKITNLEKDIQVIVVTLSSDNDLLTQSIFTIPTPDKE